MSKNQFFDEPPSEDQLKRLFMVYTFENFPIENHLTFAQFKGDMSKDFYLGMAAGAKGALGIIIKPQDSDKHFSKEDLIVDLSTMAMRIAYKKLEQK